MFGKFLLVGGLGFLVDAGLTQLLITLDIPPTLARIPAIALAMAFTWLANRYFTFSVKSDRNIPEVVRYILVALVTAFFNYAIYYLLVTVGVLPFFSVAIATAIQALLSYFGYKRFAFRSI